MKSYVMLRELLEIKNGKDYKHLIEGKIPVYGSGGVMTTVNDFLYDGESILLPRKGTLNNICYVNGKFWTVDTMYWSIINTKKVYPKYLFCYLSVLDLGCRNCGSTLPSMTYDTYYTIPIWLPSIQIQKNIANLYFEFTEKIENNNILISELASLAKTIYDYWFLQFEFPNEDGKPYKSSGGTMVWNEALNREIPEGWENGTITELGEIVGGGTPSKKRADFYTENGISWITPNDLSNTNNKYMANGEIDITETGLKQSSAVLMPKGSVLLTSRAPIGYLAVAINDVSTNQGFKSVIPANNYGTEFTYQTIQSLIPYLKSIGTGSTFTEISKSVFSEVKIVIPPTQVVKEFAEIADLLGSMQKSLEEENTELASLRDWLLPMLMNGQVTITE